MCWPYKLIINLYYDCPILKDKYLTELEESGIGDGCFVPEYVKEVDVATNSLFDDMILMCGAADSWSLLPEVLNKPSVSKSRLSEWLFSAI